MHLARHLILVVLLLPVTAWPREAVSPIAARSAAAALKRNSARCFGHADVDACSDAVRWNPSDPKLLVALADALAHAGRPGDALRNYQRAATLAPHMPGVAGKISATEAKLHPRHASATHPTVGKHISNDAPDTQSH